MAERISLEGKIAVVTGAGRGLGRAYVELLAQRGARIVVNDLGTSVSGVGKDSGIAEEVADLIRSRGGEAIANASDVSTPEGGRDLIATTIEYFGRIDLLAGLFGIRGQATYAAAKSAVVGLMRILAIEGAEHGILVNTISPNGYTRMHPAAVADPAWLKQSEATMPVEAVAPAIVWLASDGCTETNRIFNVEAGTIQRIAIVMGPGFHDPHLTPESIAEHYAKVVSIEGWSEPGPFEPE